MTLPPEPRSRVSAGFSRTGSPANPGGYFPGMEGHAGNYSCLPLRAAIRLCFPDPTSKLYSGKRGTFVIDRNISITNVCVAGCRFCAFHTPPGAKRAFTLTIDAIVAKVMDAVARGATLVILQGGLNFDLDLNFYERMFAAIKRHADVCLHSLSPAEPRYLAKRSRFSCRKVLFRLKTAGLDSLHGGGASVGIAGHGDTATPPAVNRLLPDYHIDGYGRQCYNTSVPAGDAWRFSRD